MCVVKLLAETLTVGAVFLLVLDGSVWDLLVLDGSACSCKENGLLRDAQTRM